MPAAVGHGNAGKGFDQRGRDSGGPAAVVGRDVDGMIAGLVPLPVGRPGDVPQRCAKCRPPFRIGGAHTRRRAGGARGGGCRAPAIGPVDRACRIVPESPGKAAPHLAGVSGRIAVGAGAARRVQYLEHRCAPCVGAAGLLVIRAARADGDATRAAPIATASQATRDPDIGHPVLAERPACIAAEPAIQRFAGFRANEQVAEVLIRSDVDDRVPPLEITAVGQHRHVRDAQVARERRQRLRWDTAQADGPAAADADVVDVGHLLHQRADGIERRVRVAGLRANVAREAGFDEVDVRADGFGNRLP